MARGFFHRGSRKRHWLTQASGQTGLQLQGGLLWGDGAALRARAAVTACRCRIQSVLFNVPKQLPEGQKSLKFCSAFALFVFIRFCPPETPKRQHQAMSGSEAVPFADVFSLNPARCRGTDPASPHPA